MYPLLSRHKDKPTAVIFLCQVATGQSQKDCLESEEALFLQPGQSRFLPL